MCTRPGSRFLPYQGRLWVRPCPPSLRPKRGGWREFQHHCFQTQPEEVRGKFFQTLPRTTASFGIALNLGLLFHEEWGYSFQVRVLDVPLVSPFVTGLLNWCKAVSSITRITANAVAELSFSNDDGD